MQQFFNLVIYNPYVLVIYNPILNLLVYVYNLLPFKDFGVVIIIITILIRLILYPFMQKSLKSQRKMQKIQPHLDELKEKHKDNPQELTKATFALYREHNVSFTSSCIPLLIQLPILIALYNVFNKALNGNFDGLYNFVSNPGTINVMFLGILDLTKPNIILIILVGLAQFWQTWMMMNTKKDENKNKSKTMEDNVMQMTNKMTLYTLPIITMVISYTLPAALPLYWLVMTLFSVLQQWLILRKEEK